MMQYAAITLCPDGGIVRHEETQEVANVLIGEFDSLEEAVKQACLELNCNALSQVEKGVISKGTGKGGYILVSTQELEAI